jgi:hypothetical protein
VTVIEKRDLIAMIDRWMACNEGRDPTEAENERRKCAKELNRWVRHVDRVVVTPPQPDAVDPGAAERCPVKNCRAGMLWSGGRESVSCPVCDGVIPREQFVASVRDDRADSATIEECPVCVGVGWHLDPDVRGGKAKCYACSGTGRAPGGGSGTKG